MMQSGQNKCEEDPAGGNHQD